MKNQLDNVNHDYIDFIDFIDGEYEINKMIKYFENNYNYKEFIDNFENISDSDTTLSVDTELSIHLSPSTSENNLTNSIHTTPTPTRTLSRSLSLSNSSQNSPLPYQILNINRSPINYSNTIDNYSPSYHINSIKNIYFTKRITTMLKKFSKSISIQSDNFQFKIFENIYCPICCEDNTYCIECVNKHILCCIDCLILLKNNRCPFCNYNYNIV